jgi:hypothetical protein
MASETVNGAVLHYEERGSGPPLLLVQVIIQPICCASSTMIPSGPRT